MKNNLEHIALDLLDFSGGTISVSKTKKFWMAREYSLSPEDKQRVEILAESFLTNP